MKDPVLVVMAAGLGSRYGGLKQIDPVDEHGQIIIDYSVYDAIRAGFKRIVFVIKEENLSVFKEVVAAKFESEVKVEFAFQRTSDIPQGYAVPEGREKPWGTGHAALCAVREIEAPFAIINADDFYGRQAFELIYNFLSKPQNQTGLNFAMVGYYLKNTVSDKGYVSRGVCKINDGYLEKVTERTRIEKRESAIAYLQDDCVTWTALDPDTIVSLNFFGFTNEFSNVLEDEFEKFLRDKMMSNPLKSEFFLPSAVDNAIKNRGARVEVLSSADKWYGVTYKEDKNEILSALKAMADEGIYPAPLWK